MATLTQKQELFAQAVASGKSQADAYREAYNTGNMKDSSIHVNACKLMSETKIAQRVASIQQAAATAAQLTLQAHLAKLAELRDAALAAEQYGAAIRAEELRGKAAGLYKDRVEIEGNTQQHMTVRFVRPDEVATEG